MTTITEQTIELAHNFPIGCKVQILDDNVFGRVTGYQMGASIKRKPQEVALTVAVPADRWVLYPDQVRRIDN